MRGRAEANERRGHRPQWRSGAACLALGLALSAGCEAIVDYEADRSGYRWELPVGFPRPRVPIDNPMSAAKVELGRHLFYDERLSGNQTFSCASCHEQARAFADDKARAVGSTGHVHPRSSMGLTNVGYASVLTWSNPNMRVLERQALVPMFGRDPVELGLEGREQEMLARLAAEPRYQTLFGAAFPQVAAPITLDHITKAIASFQRTLISGDAPYDLAGRGDALALSASAKRGEELFFGERTECFHCHVPPFFTAAADFEGKGFVEQEFFNNGLYNIGGSGAYPSDNPGIAEFTLRAEDTGRFKAPTLRNIELTAPYMHDGSVATLEEVIEHYAEGGRTIHAGPFAGVGSRSPYKSSFLNGFTLTPQEKTDLIEFLKSLTDRRFVTDPRFSNPWK